MKRIAIGTLLVLGMLVPGMKAVSARQDGPAPTIGYVVQQGDTLWTIAGRVDATVDRRAVVDELMDLNGMSTAEIYPGQQLRLPA